jgi:hypothetical protein
MCSEWEDLTWEARVQQLLSHVEDCAGTALNYEKLTDEEKEILGKGLKHLRPAIEELAKWFIEPLRETKPGRADCGYEQLDRILGWAFAIGSKSVVQDSAISYCAAKAATGKRPIALDDAIRDRLLTGETRAKDIYKYLLKSEVRDDLLKVKEGGRGSGLSGEKEPL